jgi:hypothetical protein
VPDDPTAPAVACTPGNVTDSVTEVVSAGNSGLELRPEHARVYVRLEDRQAVRGHTARFQFSK